MLRFVGTYGRSMLSSYPSTNTLLLRSIRPFANQQKIAQTESVDGKVRSLEDQFIDHLSFHLV